jgi:cyclophilin family peptidyl-prolyl cis-trans isomerase
MQSVLRIAVVLALATVALAAAPKAVITIKGFGEITLQLRPDAAPKTVANFIKLAQTGFYDNKAGVGKGAEFYRYAKGFVVQGGNLEAPSNATVPMEYKLPNAKYSIGLARAESPDSGSSEFFINTGNNTAHLAPGGVTPAGYCVFAEMVGGFSVLDAMEQLPTHMAEGMNMFLTPPVMQSIVINF